MRNLSTAVGRECQQLQQLATMVQTDKHKHTHTQYVSHWACGYVESYIVGPIDVRQIADTHTHTHTLCFCCHAVEKACRYPVSGARNWGVANSWLRTTALFPEGQVIFFHGEKKVCRTQSNEFRIVGCMTSTYVEILPNLSLLLFALLRIYQIWQKVYLRTSAHGKIIHVCIFAHRA